MLVNNTLEKLRSLRLLGMLNALEDQINTNEVESMKFDERLGLLVDREETHRNNTRFIRKMKQAKFKERASIEDIDYSPTRGIAKAEILSFASCDWVKNQQNILITGPTGIGKTYLACALAAKACRHGYSSRYLRTSRLFPELAIAKADGRYSKLLSSLAKTDVVIFDDWGLSNLKDEQRRDFLEIIEDRHKNSSTIITSQIPTDKWYEVIGDPTLADAILDRILHNAHRIKLTGDSLRKKKSNLTKGNELN